MLSILKKQNESNKLYQRKQKRLNHYFHSATKMIVDYCVHNHISKVIIGDIKGIRKNKNLGKVINQKLHSLPYDRIYSLLSYKFAKQGIELIKQKEVYSSQVSPFAPEVSKKYATPESVANVDFILINEHCLMQIAWEL